MRKELIKFLSREDIQKALKTDDVKYCYEILEELVNNFKVTYNLMNEFTQLLLSANIDILKYLDKIYTYQFSGMPLTNITIPNKIKSIGLMAFGDCDDLTSVEIPDSVEKIEDWAFAHDVGITDLKIGNGVTSIGNNAFGGCAKLTSITIPDNVTSIGEGAFRRCYGLENVTIPQRFMSSLYEIFGEHQLKINFTFI